MTRINFGICPTELSGPHLIAEHREIVRIPNCISSGKAKVENIPEKFKLGSGHVKFFYDKLQYLFKRYSAIYAECIRRGYNVTDMSDAFTKCLTSHSHLFNNTIPTIEDRAILIDRLVERDQKFYANIAIKNKLF